MLPLVIIFIWILHYSWKKKKRRLLFLQSISNNKYKFFRCPFLMFFLCQVSVKLERTFEVYVERMYIVCTLKPFWICLNTFKRNFSENQVRYLRKQICSKYCTILLLDDFFAVKNLVQRYIEIDLSRLFRYYILH